MQINNSYCDCWQQYNYAIQVYAIAYLNTQTMKSTLAADTLPVELESVSI